MEAMVGEWDEDYVAEDDDCLCEYADKDILSGRAHCSSCGRAWWMTTEQIQSELRFHAEYAEAAEAESR
jgi:hypothetical protein